MVDGGGQVITTDSTAGELYVRGPGLFNGYKGIAEAKEEGGWFRTGDIVSVRGGDYYLLGRSKELIKVRG